MHPINSKNFGAFGISVTFYDGSDLATGYIVKQLSQYRFVITDGATTKVLSIAPTTDIATALDSNPDYFTIPVYPNHNNATSGTIFTPSYTANVVQPWFGGGITGRGYFVGDQLRLNGTNNARVTVASVDVNGAVISATVTTLGLPAGTSTPTPTTFYSGGTSFQGSTATNVLTVSSVTLGPIMQFQMLHGTSVPAGTIITSQLTGTTGGIGTYRLNRTVGTIGSEAMTSNGNGAFFEVGYVLSVMDISGPTGTGYSVNDTFVFQGLHAKLSPTAYISAVSGENPTAISFTPGRYITRGEDSLYISGPVEYANSINAKRVSTTNGNSYYWTLGTSNSQSALIQAYTVPD